MAKAFAKSFYKSKRWQDCRQSFIAERMLVDGGLCQLCKERHGFIVHHKIMINESNINNPDVTLNYDNLLYVCKKCHDDLPGHGIGGCAPKNIFLMRAECSDRLSPPLKNRKPVTVGPRGAVRFFARLII